MSLPTAYTKFDPTNPPPPLMTGEPNSFAQRTMTTRIPAIVRQVLADHAGMYSPKMTGQLYSLHDELVEDKPLHPLEDPAPDKDAWLAAWAPHRAKSWLNIPWYFAEAYLYRRIMEAVGHFGAGKWAGHDPFLPSKQAELAGDTAWHVLHSASSQAAENSLDSLRKLLHFAVWGNRVDLSYTQVAQSTGGKIALEREQGNLLVDDTHTVLAHLAPSTAGRRLDFICDNAGTELLTDLALVDFLLKYRWVERVTLHVKAHPTYVSDTTAADIGLTLTAMKSKNSGDFTGLATRLERFLNQKQLLIRPDFFWNSSCFFWEFSPELRADLAQAHLVIIKGDANYRRLLGDSRWPTTVPLIDAVPYFPAPFAALRTLKSDPIVGLQPGQAEALELEDPAWRVNGQRGMIQAGVNFKNRS